MGQRAGISEGVRRFTGTIGVLALEKIVRLQQQQSMFFIARAQKEFFNQGMAGWKTGKRHRFVQMFLLLQPLA